MPKKKSSKESLATNRRRLYTDIIGNIEEDITYLKKCNTTFAFKYGYTNYYFSIMLASLNNELSKKKIQLKFWQEKEDIKFKRRGII